MSKKFKFPPIPAHRCPDSLKQEMMTRDSQMNKKDMPEADTFTDGDIDVKSESDGIFLIKLTDPAEGIGKIDFSGENINDVKSYKEELEKELEIAVASGNKSGLYIESLKDRIKEAEDHISKTSNVLEILANGKIRVLERGAVEFSIGSHKALALYILYIRHTEGINRKDPLQYRNELKDIFKFFWGVTGDLDEKVNKLTTISENKNPFDTEISKLRRAFYEKITNKDTAEKFLPSGKRGEFRKLNHNQIRFILPKGL